jgi:hypothetical protein
MSTRLDLAGQRYGRWLVLRFHHVDPSGNKYWECECECGTVKPVTANSLRQGTSQSCGCLPSRRLAGSLNGNYRHGYSMESCRTPTYISWCGMIQRCTNPRNPRWMDYGGRGITVCERWRSFENFLADMGERPSGLTLDRRDNDGNYEPGNCHWATQSEQVRNQRRNNTWRTRLSAAKILKVRDLHDEGLGISAIADEVGFERHYVGAVVLTIEALRSEPHS